VGFGKPMYVVAKDAVNNTVTLGENNDLLSGGLIADDVNFIPFETAREPLAVAAKIRYNQKEQPAVVRILPNGFVEVLFDKPQRAVAPGHSVVFYRDELVVGGGIICRAIPVDRL